MGGKDAVHVMVALFEPLHHMSLPRHAPGQENLLPRMAALGMGQGAHVAEDPLLGMLPDGAGVDDHHIGALSLRLPGISHLPEHAQHPFAVRLVLLAAVGVDPGRGRLSPVLPPGPDLLRVFPLDFQLLLCDDLCIRRHKTTSARSLFGDSARRHTPAL